MDAEAHNPLITSGAAIHKDSADMEDSSHQHPPGYTRADTFSPISSGFTNRPFSARDRERHYAHDPSYEFDKEPEQVPATRYAKLKAELLPVMRRKWPAIFASVVGVQAIICLTFEIYVFMKFQDRLRARIQNNYEQQVALIPLFLPLFIFGFVYENVIAWDALRAKNTIQIIGVCVANVALNIYTAVQIDQVKEGLYVMEDNDALRPGHDAESVFNETKVFLLIVPCFIALCTGLMVFSAWKLYQEFAWNVLKFIGADYAMKKRLLYYQIYIAMLKFDFFFVGGFMIQLVSVVTKKTDPEFGLTIAAIPITVAILVLAAYATRWENRWGMMVTIALYLGALSYFIFKLVRMNLPEWRRYYRAVRKPLAAFAVMAILLIVATIINAIYCMFNFDKGLSQYFKNKRADAKQSHEQEDDAEHRRLRITIE